MSLTHLPNSRHQRKRKPRAQRRIAQRRNARHIALECLYELDCTTHSVDAVIRGRFADSPPVDDRTAQIILELIENVRTHFAVFDSFIAETAPQWPVEQLSIIDRNALRMSLAELVVTRKLPFRIVISETLEVGKLYGTESSARFINGVLGSLMPRIDEIAVACGLPPLPHDDRTLPPLEAD